MPRSRPGTPIPRPAVTPYHTQSREGRGTHAKVWTHATHFPLHTQAPGHERDVRTPDPSDMGNFLTVCYLVQLVSALGPVQAAVLIAAVLSVFPVGDWLVKPATGFLANNPDARVVPGRTLLPRTIAAGVYLVTVSCGAIAWIVHKSSLVQVVGLGFTAVLSVLTNWAHRPPAHQ